MKKLLLVFIFILFYSCDKIPYEQYYIWENNTDTTFILEINPIQNEEHPYFPITASDNIWPPPITKKIEPHSSYILKTTMLHDYYGKWYCVGFGNIEIETIYTCDYIDYVNIINSY